MENEYISKRSTREQAARTAVLDELKQALAPLGKVTMLPNFDGGEGFLIGGARAMVHDASTLKHAEKFGDVPFVYGIGSKDVYDEQLFSVDDIQGAVARFTEIITQSQK